MVYLISESKENYLYSAYILSVVSALCQNRNNCYLEHTSSWRKPSHCV